MRLDAKLKKQFTEENFINLFNELVESKTDKYTNKILIPLGVDGVEYENIKRNLDSFAKSVCNRANKGTYLFSPFRETLIPKAPFSKNELDKAKKEGKTRTLAICTIRDTIFQKMIYNAIYNFTDKKIQKFDNSIYGYRKGKSVSQAIRKIQEYIEQGYMYGIDGDIKKFFDEIDHQRMIKKIEKFYKNNPLTIKYLYRFLNVQKVEVSNVLRRKDYYNKKPKTTLRTIGIPQGGVLSGLLANVYLYNYDKYVIKILSNQYNIKYVRYADDFLILTKDKNVISEIYKKIHRYFAREKLVLHPIDMSALDNSKPDKTRKTKAFNFFNKNYIDFLGFRISPNFIGIKQDNIKKFKNSISYILDQCKKEKLDIFRTIHKINAKILGNALFSNELFAICSKCGKPQKPQSWIGFFSNITDLRQIKCLDVWIRRQLFNYYFSTTKKRLEKNFFRKKTEAPRDSFYYVNLASLYSSYLEIKETLKKNKNIKYCTCEHFEPIEEYTLS